MPARESKHLTVGYNGHMTPLGADPSTVTLAGRPVARIGFGAMQLPGPGVWGPPRDRDAALAVLRRAVELGVNHIDTAQYYGPDVSNELIHAALHPYPEDLVLVSKVGGARDERGGWIRPCVLSNCAKARGQPSKLASATASTWSTCASSAPRRVARSRLTSRSISTAS